MNNEVSDSEYKILWRVKIAGIHKPTGKTEHYSSDGLLPTPSELQIAQYSGDDGFYLFYVDDDGEELTDTYHDDIQGAMEQANWEYAVKPIEWKKEEE